MNFSIETLLKNKPVLLDGSWGTELQKMGLNPGNCPDEWNLTNPDKVFKVAEDYVMAGSRIILTNTFRSNKIALSNFNLENSFTELNKKGVEISKEAAAGRAKVFASIGPSGKLLATGEINVNELEDIFIQQAEIIAEAGADGIVIETMSDLNEAIIALKSVRKTNLTVAVCMVFDSGKEKDKTMMGDSIENVVKSLVDEGADIIGANCGQGIESFIKTCSSMKKLSPVPVWIKPNAGIPKYVNGKIIYDTSPEDFASFIPSLLEAGADFVGGCCGTTPDYIKLVGKKIEEFKTH